MKLHPLRGYEFTLPKCTFSVPVSELTGDAMVRSLTRFSGQVPWIMQPVDIATMEKAMAEPDVGGEPVIYHASEGRLHVWPSPLSDTRFRIEIVTA